MVIEYIQKVYKKEYDKNYDICRGVKQRFVPWRQEMSS